MKKRIVALALAGVMIASQLMGTVELSAAGERAIQSDERVEPAKESDSSSASDREENNPSALEEAVGSVGTSVEGANGFNTLGEGVNNVSTSAEVKGILKSDGKVYQRTAEDIATDTEIRDLDTVTDLLVAQEVVTVDSNKFAGKTNLRKLRFENPDTNTTTRHIGDSAFRDTRITDLVLSQGIMNIHNSAFKDVTTLTKVVSGSGLARIGEEAFKGTTSLKEVDFRKAGELMEVGSRSFEGSSLAKMYIGKKTGNFVSGIRAFDTTAPRREVHFLDDHGNYIQGEDFEALKRKWDKLTEKNKGSWRLVSKMTPATPNAQIDYPNMKLTGLNASLPYEYTVNGEVEDMAVSSDGTTPILSKWSNKSVKIVSKETDDYIKSDPQTITIKAIYTIAVDGKKERETVQGENITLTAQEIPGYAFVQWRIPDGITVSNVQSPTITFTMPAKNLEFTTVYKTTTPLKPEAAADYEAMKLTGLNPSGIYKITVDNETTKTNADSEGKISVLKAWGGKTIQIVALSSDSKYESAPQELSIRNIYTVTLDGVKQLDAVSGKSCTFTAQDKTGFAFAGWTATGLTGVDLSQQVLTFSMPESDVTLHTTYKKNGEKPKAVPNYGNMTLTALVPGAMYTIDGESMNADGGGAIAIKKEWSNKNITIVKQETSEETQSPPQTLQIKPIYTVIVDGKKLLISVKGETITVKAQIPEGHQFKMWTAEGVNIADATQETITFEMPGNDVILTPSYTQIIMTKPDDLVYNGEGQLSVILEVSHAEFQGIEVNGQMLVEGKDYTIAENKEGVALASESITITFTETYLDTLDRGVNIFKVVLTRGTVEFSVKVEEKPVIITYPDVKEGDWFYEAVNYISSQGLMTGYVNGNFGPADDIGRAQFATILYRMEGSPKIEYKNIFSDVPSGQFYSLAVVWAQTNNVITGYEDGRFGVSDSITREQLATMLYRYAVTKGHDVSAQASLDSFPDSRKVSTFARQSLSWAVGKGIISGDQGNLNPQGRSSRAVAATMLQRFQTKK